jgi:hypothetical protein
MAEPKRTHLVRIEKELKMEWEGLQGQSIKSSLSNAVQDLTTALKPSNS